MVLSTPQSRWNQRNRAVLKRANKKWRKKHPLKVRAKNWIMSGRRRARQHGVSIKPFTYVQWMAKVKQYGGYCAYCDSGFYEQADHVVPLSRGGAHSLKNMVPCCASCNCRKKKQIWTPRKPCL